LTALSVAKYPRTHSDFWQIGCVPNPEVPGGKWFKIFSGMIVCGEGQYIKTFLIPGQLPDGREIS
jgi:hypothetical protein